MRSFTLVLACALTFSVAVASADSGSGLNSDPVKVKIVTSDISNFWRAADTAESSSNPQRVFADRYFAPGTRGLWGFIPGRLDSPWHLVDVVRKYSAYYAAARTSMERIPLERSRIIADFERFKRLDPEALFPDVYFVVGTLNSGGTSVDGVGLIIGAEMVSRPRVLPSMPGFQNSVLASSDRIAPLVSHEATHYNQHDGDEKTLLDNAIYEGTAEFMSEMVDAGAPDMKQWAFDCRNETALWQAFVPLMASTDGKLISTWLYSFDPGPLGAPPFAGYWLGSRIVQTYYATHADKRRAIASILHVTDYQAFLNESGYPDRRPACTPPTS